MFDRLVVEEEFNGKSLKDYLTKKLKISRRTITSLKKNAGTCINGEPRKVDTLLKEGDAITLVFPDVVDSDITAEKMELEIAFEDEYLIVINKKAGVPVHPCRNYTTGTLANGLMELFKRKNERATMHPVTRLDKDTSGLTLFAKHPHIQHLLGLEENKEQFKKEYTAFIEGKINPADGLINLPIERLEEGKVSRGVVENGAPSLTEYKTTESYESFSVVEVVLHTGRTHQIRVHFSHLGHPLLGDDLYGGDCAMISRQALHARKLSFLHPITEKEIIIETDLPQDMLRILELSGSEKL